MSRSKLEVLYRDLLEHCHTITTRLEQLSNKLDAVQQRSAELPQAVRQAGEAVAQNASLQASRELYKAANLAAGHQRSLQTTLAKLSAFRHTISWTALSLGMACGLIGGVIGALVVLATLPH